MSNKPLLASCQIIENNEISPGYFMLKIDPSSFTDKILPGQFLNLRVTDRLDLIFRRPFSVFDFDETGVSILYEVVGKGTAIMSKKEPGDEIDVLGPLGNGFTLPENVNKAIIVAGGVGIAPFYAWSKYLIDLKKQGKELDVQVFIGANNKHRILCKEEFKNLGINPIICTDDGTYGDKGYVTEILEKYITNNSDKELELDNDVENGYPFVYACGPNMMLKSLANILSKYNIKGQVSIDKYMGCGTGVCMGCVVETVDGKYKRVCKDGPIFSAEDIKWD